MKMTIVNVCIFLLYYGLKYVLGQVADSTASIGWCCFYAAKDFFQMF